MSYLQKLKQKKTASSPTAKTVKRPFGTFDSTPERPFSENELEIQEMTKCLHGHPCDFLQSTPPERPICSIAGKAVFDLKRCPKGLWK